MFRHDESRLNLLTLAAQSNLTDSRVSPDRTAALWARVGELIDCAPNPWALRTHGLGLLALQRLGETGRQIPRWLVLEQRAAALISLVPGYLVVSANAFLWDAERRLQPERPAASGSAR